MSAQIIPFPARREPSAAAEPSARSRHGAVLLAGGIVDIIRDFDKAQLAELLQKLRENHLDEGIPGARSLMEFIRIRMSLPDD